MRLPRIEVRTGNAAPIVVGDAKVVLRSWSLAAYGTRWGAVWNCPATVVVERGANVQSYPIVDITIVFHASCGLLIIAWLVVKTRFRAAHRA